MEIRRSGEAYYRRDQAGEGWVPLTELERSKKPVRILRKMRDSMGRDTYLTSIGIHVAVVVGYQGEFVARSSDQAVGMPELLAALDAVVEKAQNASLP